MLFFVTVFAIEVLFKLIPVIEASLPVPPTLAIVKSPTVLFVIVLVEPAVTRIPLMIPDVVALALLFLRLATLLSLTVMAPLP